MIAKRSTVVALVILGAIMLTGSNALPTARDPSAAGIVTVTAGESQFFNGAYHTVLNITNVDSPQPVEVLVLSSPTGEQVFNFNTGNSGWVAYLTVTTLTYETYDGNHIHYGVSKGDSMAVLTVLALSTGFSVDWSAYTKQGNEPNERYLLLDQGTMLL